jgi:hypothetical protein
LVLVGRFGPVLPGRAISVIPPCLTGLVFENLDELRCRPTDWLRTGETSDKCHRGVRC